MTEEQQDFARVTGLTENQVYEFDREIQGMADALIQAYNGNIPNQPFQVITPMKLEGDHLPRYIECVFIMGYPYFDLTHYRNLTEREYLTIVREKSKLLNQLTYKDSRTTNLN